MFYDIYARLCSEKGVSPSRAAVDMGFYRSSVSYWKNKGGSPGRDGLRKMSEYFGVSEDVLTEVDSSGEKAEELTKPPEQKKAADKTAKKKSDTEESEKSDIVGNPAKTTPAQNESTQTENTESLYYSDTKNINPQQTSAHDDADTAEARKSDFTLAMEMANAIEYINEIKQEMPEKLGDRIRQLRKQQGLSANYVAKAVDVDTRTYLMWESGEIKEIRRYKLGKLAKIMGTTIDYIQGADDIPDVIRGIGRPDMGPFVELIRTRGECLALLLMARDMSREDVEMTISFMRSLISG